MKLSNLLPVTFKLNEKTNQIEFSRSPLQKLIGALSKAIWGNKSNYSNEKMSHYQASPSISANPYIKQIFNTKINLTTKVSAKKSDSYSAAAPRASIGDRTAAVETKISSKQRFDPEDFSNAAIDARAAKRRALSENKDTTPLPKHLRDRLEDPDFNP